MARAPAYRAWEGVPLAMIRTAKARTEFLRTAHISEVLPVPMLLVNAYLQGIADATETAAAMMHRDGSNPIKQTAPGGIA